MSYKLGHFISKLFNVFASNVYRKTRLIRRISWVASCSEHHDKWFQFFRVWIFLLLAQCLAFHPFARDSYHCMCGWVCGGGSGSHFPRSYRINLHNDAANGTMNQPHALSCAQKTRLNDGTVRDTMWFSLSTKCKASTINQRAAPSSSCFVASHCPSAATKIAYCSIDSKSSSPNTTTYCGTCEYVIQSFPFFPTTMWHNEWSTRRFWLDK